MINVHPRFRPPRAERGKKRPKRKREGNDDRHLANLRKLPCCVCGSQPPNTVHHLKATGQRGVSLKSPDKFGLPLCWFPRGENCHGQVEDVGSKNELDWFRARGIRALELADALWSARHSPAAMLAALLAHRFGG